MNVVWIDTPEQTRKIIRKKIMITGKILDIGPGIQPQSFFTPRVHLCVDPYLPYLEHLNNKRSNSTNGRIYLNTGWETVLKMLPDQSIDSIFALDMIEHIEKDEGIRFLQEAQRVVKHQIVIFTPLGFYPQSYDETDKMDRWGMQGGHWQTHRSGWNPEDFGEDWELICCKNYHSVDQYGQPLEEPFGAIWAFYETDAPNTYKYPLYNSIQDKVRYLSQNIKSILKKNRLIQSILNRHSD